MSASSQLSTKALLEKLTTKLTKKNLTDVDQLDNLESKLQKLIAVVRGKRNLLAPINRLPPEVIVDIFAWSQQPLASFMPVPSAGTTEYEPIDWMRFLHVCRHWRGIAATGRRLWCAIDNAYSPDKFLRRSGELPITVFFGVRKGLASSSEMRLLTPHIDRIKELHLGFPRTLDAGAIPEIYASLSPPARRLYSLSIETRGPLEGDTFVPGLFSEEMPHLRQLSLEFYTDWPRTYFRNLTHLCLHHQPIESVSRASTNEFLDMLEGSPRLEELILVQAGPTRHPEQDIPSPAFGRCVHLPYMRRFSWGEPEDMVHVRRLLSFLVLPETTELYFWGSAHANGADLANFLPADLSHLPCMLDKTEWRVRCANHPSGLYLLAFVGDTLYTLDVAWESYIVNMHKAYAPILSTVERFFVLDNINIAPELWKDVFTALPALTELSIQPPQQWGSSINVLSALYPDDAHEGTLRLGLKHMFGVSTAMCPRLRALYIEADPGFQGFDISSFAKARLRRGSALQYVEIRHLRKEDTVQDIILPSGDVNGAWFTTISPATGKQERLEVEDMHALEKSVKKVKYLHDQKATSFEPPTWPTAGFTWTTMPFRYQD